MRVSEFVSVPAPRKPTYDLATKRGDHPKWDGPPARSIVVCSHPRSGSTVLGEAMYAAGGLGCPLEYFHRGFRTTFASRWDARNLQELIARVHENRTDPSGVFSLKLFWYDVHEIVRETDPGTADELDPSRPPASPDVYVTARRCIADIIPNPRFVYLRRLDRIRQAVSRLIAAETGAWRSVGNDTDAVGREASYDYGKIMALLSDAERCAAHWTGFFVANQIEPLDVTHEEILRGHGIGRVLRWLGYDGPVPPERLRRQSGEKSEQLVRRFLLDYLHRPRTDD